jgi:hypothetical protein
VEAAAALLLSLACAVDVLSTSEVAVALLLSLAWAVDVLSTSERAVALLLPLAWAVDVLSTLEAAVAVLLPGGLAASWPAFPAEPARTMALSAGTSRSMEATRPERRPRLARRPCSAEAKPLRLREG